MDRKEVEKKIAEAFGAVLDYAEFTGWAVPPVDQPVPDPKPPVQSGKRFFEIIGHRNPPDFKAMGLDPIKIFYEGAFFDERDNRDSRDPAKYVSFQNVKIDWVARTAKAAPSISVPDVERWTNKHTWEIPEDNIRRYVDFANTYRINLPDGHTFGFYTVPPARNYNAVFAGESSSKWQDWQKWNDRMRPIGEKVDYCFPSLYAPASVFQGKANRIELWRKFAIANIGEARRIMGRDKPIYAFLWPWYHPAGKVPIEPDFWRAMLETCAEYGDGFVIWDDEKDTIRDYDDLPPYKDETRRFMETVR